MVIQAVNPWISNDMAKGARWSPEISERLSQSKMGIFCLTPENLHSDWILFEAGAISKIKNNNVCTFLYNLTPAEIEQPLAQFQHTIFQKDDVKKLIKTINEEIEHPLAEKTLDAVFEKNWSDLESRLKLIPIPSKTESKKSGRGDREILEEILELTRRLSDNTPLLNKDKQTKQSKDNLVRLICQYPELRELYDYFDDLKRKEKTPAILAADSTFRKCAASNIYKKVPKEELDLFFNSL